MTQHRQAAGSLWLTGACGVCNLYVQHHSCFLPHAVDQKAVLPCGCDKYGNCHGQLGANIMFHAEHGSFAGLLLYASTMSMPLYYQHDSVAHVFTELEMTFGVILNQSFECF